MVAAVVVAGLVTVPSVLLLGGGDDRPVARTGSGPTPTPHPALPSPSPSPSPKPSPSAPPPAPSSVGPTPPPGLPWPDGVVVRATLDGRDALAIEQWVVSEGGLARLAVSMPRNPVLGGVTEAVGLAVEVDGTRVPAPSSVRGAAVELPVRGSHVVRLTYRIPDAVVLSSTRPDRGLAPVLALRTEGPERTRTMLVLSGLDAVGLACTGSGAESSGATRPCGHRDATGDWLVGRRSSGGGGITALLELSDGG